MEENVGSPTTEAELKDAIKKYQDRVTDIQLANSQIGIWYKMLATRYLDAKMYGEALKTFQTAIQYYPANQNLFIMSGFAPVIWQKLLWILMRAAELLLKNSII